MDMLRTEDFVRHMYYEEYLTEEEISKALCLDVDYVKSVIKK